MFLTRWKPSLMILALWAAASTANAAAPHIIIYHGAKLSKPIVVSAWDENHRLMASLSEEGLVKLEEITTREYVELSMFWGPQWVNYKVDSGLELRPEQGNQTARLYFGTESSPPVLHLEGRSPRYVGHEGVLMLARHGIPMRTAANSLSQKNLLLPALAIALFATTGFFILRKQRRHSYSNKFGRR